MTVEEMKDVPAGCFVFPISNEKSAPNFQCGEFAVIDANDRDPVFGQLYVIEYPPSGIRFEPYRKIVEVCRFGNSTLLDGSPAYHVASAARDQHIPGHGMCRMLDGAYDRDGLRSRLIGRVIGRLARPAQP